MLFQAFIKQRKAQVAGLAGLGLVAGGLEGAFILLGKALLTRNWQVTPVEPRPWFAGWWAAAALFAVVTARSLAQMAAARLESRTVFAWIGERRRALLELGLGRDFPAYRSPFRETWIEGLREGPERLGEGLMAALRCLGAFCQGAVLLPLLLCFSWKPALGALALAVPAVGASRWRARALNATSRGREGAQTEALQALDGFSEGLEDAFGNGFENESAADLSASLDRREDGGRRWEDARAVFPPALEWFFFLVLAAWLWLATAFGGGTPASLIPFSALLLLLYRPIREWARNFPVYLPGDAAWQGFQGLQGELAALPPRRRPRVSTEKRICFRDVRFGYAGNLRGAPARFILDGFSLELDPEALTLVSGPNGAGKSTLLKLLAGLENPQGGSLAWPEALLRNGEGAGISPAYLPQRAYVGEGFRSWTLEYGRKDPAAWEDLDRILGVAAILQKAGSGPGWARGLSGGERQRLALARAFAAETGYLLLDEPTTFLGAEDRERVMGDLLAFWRRRAPRGALLVSHEPCLAEFCSRTFRLEKPAPRSAPAGRADAAAHPGAET